MTGLCQKTRTRCTQRFFKHKRSHFGSKLTTAFIPLVDSKSFEKSAKVTSL